MPAGDESVTSRLMATAATDPTRLKSAACPPGLVMAVSMSVTNLYRSCGGMVLPSGFATTALHIVQMAPDAAFSRSSRS
eukprot:1321981-Pyramimonas_sp.AAC.2